MGGAGSPRLPSGWLRPASDPVAHREQDSMRRALRSMLPTLESNYILSSTLSISRCKRERVGQALEQRLGNYHDLIFGS
jgi:hypothetical protein